MKTTEDEKAPGLLTAARAVANYASAIQRIVKIESADAYTSQIAGYFVPKDKIDALRESIDAMEKFAEEAKQVLTKLQAEEHV